LLRIGEDVTRKREHNRAIAALFAHELKAQREARGWTQEELATRTNYAPSTIDSIETMALKAQAKSAKAFDEVFELPGTFARLEEMMSGSVYPASFAPFTEYEAEAKTLRTFQHSLIPGLLQTEPYARAVLSTKPNAGQDQIDRLVLGRLARQAVLRREHPPLIYALVDEGVLYRPVAERGAMHDQLMHLVELSREPNITIQVVPYSAGGHSGLLGAATIAEISDKPGIVAIEDACDGRVAEDAEMVDLARMVFEALRSEAMNPSESRTLMEKVAKEKWS
jgi:transcriptional regulator with XRE-family HTH domain